MIANPEPARPISSMAPQARSSAELRRLASWYRSYAERAGSPAIWEKRLLTAERLDEEAAQIERTFGPACRVTRRGEQL